MEPFSTSKNWMSSLQSSCDRYSDRDLKGYKLRPYLKTKTETRKSRTAELQKTGSGYINKNSGSMPFYEQEIPIWQFTYHFKKHWFHKNRTVTFCLQVGNRTDYINLLLIYVYKDESMCYVEGCVLPNTQFQKNYVAQAH